jgi:hypothetical protein
LSLNVGTRLGQLVRRRLKATWPGSVQNLSHIVGGGPITSGRGRVGWYLAVRRLGRVTAHGRLLLPRHPYTGEQEIATYGPSGWGRAFVSGYGRRMKFTDLGALSVQATTGLVVPAESTRLLVRFSMEGGDF